MKVKSVSEDGSRKLQILLAETANRNEIAFGKLYRLTRRKLFATAMSIVQRNELAEEIIQDAYLRIWIHAASYNPKLSSPMTWMMTVVRNLSITIARKPLYELRSGDDFLSLVPDDTMSALDEILGLEEQQLLSMALKNLDPFPRRLVSAAYLEGESRENLAKRFSTPENTIKTWLRRAIFQMRVCVANERGKFPLSDDQASVVVSVAAEPANAPLTASR